METETEVNQTVEPDAYDEEDVKEFVMEFASFNLLMKEASQAIEEKSSVASVKELAKCIKKWAMNCKAGHKKIIGTCLKL